MKQGKKLLILPAVAVLLGMGTGCSDNSENKAQDMAKKALMASVDNPESVKIVGISKPDSVFGREYVTMKEKMGEDGSFCGHDENQPQVYGGYGF